MKAAWAMGGIRGRTQSGSSLIEVCVALTILATVFPALMLFLVTVLKANAISTDANSARVAQTQAESFAKFGLTYPDPVGSTYKDCGPDLRKQSEDALNAEFLPTTTTTTVGATTTTTVGVTTTTAVLPSAPTFEILSIMSRNPLTAAAGLAIGSSAPGGPSSVWATDAGADSLLKIDKATNQVTSKWPVDDSPQGVAVGASYVWVANFAGNSVSRVDPSVPGPAGVETIGVGVGPYGVAIAGDYVWVTNSGTETAPSNTVSKINWKNDPPTEDARITVGDRPRGIASDGTSMWVANSKDESVSRIKISDSEVTTFLLPHPLDEFRKPEGIAVGAGSVWVANAGFNSVSRINSATGSVVETIPVGSTGPQGLSFDGTAVWVNNFGSDNVWKIDPATNTATVASAGVEDPIGIAADSTSVWVAGSTGGTVSRIDPASRSLAATVDLSLGPCWEPPYPDPDPGVQVWKVKVTSGSQVNVFEFLKVKR